MATKNRSLPIPVLQGYQGPLHNKKRLAAEAIEENLSDDLLIFRQLYRWGDIPIQDARDADANIKQAIEYGCKSHSNSYRVLEALVYALSQGTRLDEVNGEELYLGDRKFRNARELKAYCQSILRSYEDGQLLKEEDSVKIRELLAYHPKGEAKVKGCVGFRVGRHPTFNVRCLFVVRNDGSPDEDFSYIRCVDRVPSFETKCQQRVCRAIIALLQVNPEAKTKLADLVAPRFPALRGLTATVPRHRNWARCLLSLCSQMRELIMFLPLLIVRSMVEVDADICKLEDEPPEDCYGEGGAEHGQDYDYDSMANILDCQVMLFFEFLQTQLAKAPKAASQEVEDRIFEEQRELVIAMMIIFDHVLLQTHNVRCVQFLWFYLSSMSPVWAEGFLQTLLLVGARKTEMAEKRCRAFSYLASFVARAKFLNAKFALKCCEHLAVTGNALYEALELGNIAPLSKDDVFRILASLVQAFCYIIIWKAKEIHEETDKNGVKVLDLVLPEVGQVTESDQSLTSVLASRHKLVALIRRPVAKEFCRAIGSTRPKLVEIIQSHFQSVPASAIQDAKLLKATGYFPFDPFRLVHSNIFLIGIYKTWKHGDDGFEDEDEEEEDVVSESPSESADSDMEDVDQDNFTDEPDIASRGFTPLVGPSPAFRPDADMEMVSPILGALLPPPMELDEDDDILPPQAIDTDNFMSRRLASQSYAMGLMDDEL